MGKIKTYFKKNNKELVVYFFVGLLTTVVAKSVYFGSLIGLKSIFNISDIESFEYTAINLVAHVLHWVAAVIFAFFTNRKWVFTQAEKDVPMFPQFLKFAGSRLLSFAIETPGVIFMPIVIASCIPLFETIVAFDPNWVTKYIPIFSALSLEGLTLAELLATVIVSTTVMILNYILSKLLIFKDKK